MAEDNTQGGTGAVPEVPQSSPDAPPATWDEVFKHPRFKGLDKKAKEAERTLAQFQQQQAQAEEQKLAEQNEWRQLAEKRQKEAQELLAQLEGERQGRQRDTKRRAVEDAARSHEPAFIPEAIPVLLRMVELDDIPDGEDMTRAVSDTVKALAKANGYMLQQPRTDPGSPPGRKPAGTPKPTGTGKPMGL